MFEQNPSPHIACLLSLQPNVAERIEGTVSGFFMGQPEGTVIVDFHLDVEPKLIAEIVLQLVAAKERTQLIQ
jgi:hypothetical protein